MTHQISPALPFWFDTTPAWLGDVTKEITTVLLRLSNKGTNWEKLLSGLWDITLHIFTFTCFCCGIEAKTDLDLVYKPGNNNKTGLLRSQTPFRSHSLSCVTNRVRGTQEWCLWDKLTWNIVVHGLLGASSLWAGMTWDIVTWSPGRWMMGTSPNRLVLPQCQVMRGAGVYRRGNGRELQPTALNTSGHPTGGSKQNLPDSTATLCGQRLKRMDGKDQRLGDPRKY